ncbi:SFSWA-like protein [Mya arenaria]|uniref:SFSWA-like protein n=1 Tax=Mya arenaria TaxID=6604 RepID=A0ABY7DWX0_MYAAR|nr:SFSWA-like protein [Mya arenaria]
MASEWLFPTNSEPEERDNTSRNEELFVFGYACKLFRDDEQAKLVDKGKFLIPWMGDENLKIDRYDGRGHLFDLRPYDADNKKGRLEPKLTDDEENMEKLCDEERYLELHTDIEEWKRYYESLDEGYKAVEFSYDSYGQPVYAEQQVAEENKPTTNKENAIIEKTAKFIAEHGTQMEIVMKTKQANNPAFNFMHFENELHPYYKHMIKMIKTKKYIPKSPVKTERQDSHNDSQSEYSGPPPPGIEPVELPVTKIKQEPPDESEAGQKKQANGEAEDDSSAKIVPPPPDAQPIIDRMAMYVAKNGDEFAIVEMERERREKEEEEKRREAERAEQLARGVKFKLKNVKEQEEKKGPLERKAVFGHDESTDEESEGMRPSKSRSATASGTSTPIPDVTAIPETKNDEHMEKKLAEQRVKDRIAASAREKLSQADREAQMKLERKKKAAMSPPSIFPPPPPPRSKERPPTVSLPSVQEEAIPTVPSIDRQPDPRVMSPAGVAMDTPEEGETRESTPEPGQITDTASERDHSERSMKKNADIDSDGGSTLSSPKKRYMLDRVRALIKASRKEEDMFADDDT